MPNGVCQPAVVAVSSPMLVYVWSTDVALAVLSCFAEDSTTLPRDPDIVHVAGGLLLRLVSCGFDSARETRVRNAKLSVWIDTPLLPFFDVRAGYLPPYLPCHLDCCSTLLLANPRPVPKNVRIAVDGDSRWTATYSRIFLRRRRWMPLNCFGRLRASNCGFRDMRNFSAGLSFSGTSTAISNSRSSKNAAFIAEPFSVKERRE